MEGNAKKANTLKSCFDASKIRDIDGKILGKDGKPMKPAHCVQFSTRRGTWLENDEATPVEDTLKNSVVKEVEEGVNAEDPIVKEGASTCMGTKCYVNVVSAEQKNPKTNFRTLFNKEKVDESDCVLPVENVMAAQKLSKDKVTKVPVWVKIHKVHVVAYCEDGLSLIATLIGRPIMLDSFTSSMCSEPCGQLGFARALIKVSADKELKQVVTMAVPIIDGEGYTKERMNEQDDVVISKVLGESSGYDGDASVFGTSEIETLDNESEVEEMGNKYNTKDDNTQRERILLQDVLDV
ncbi:putative nucleotidyltransferase, ribonuclease H [Tanacetum coccineum]